MALSPLRDSYGTVLDANETALRELGLRPADLGRTVQLRPPGTE